MANELSSVRKTVLKLQSLIDQTSITDFRRSGNSTIMVFKGQTFRFGPDRKTEIKNLSIDV